MDDVVVLPHMSVTLAVDGDSQKAAIEAARQGNRLILLVPRIDGQYGKIGTVARLGESAELPTGAEAFIIRGEYRAQLLIKGMNRKRIREALQTALASRPELQRRVVVDVDPLSVL